MGGRPIISPGTRVHISAVGETGPVSIGLGLLLSTAAAYWNTWYIQTSRWLHACIAIAVRGERKSMRDERNAMNSLGDSLVPQAAAEHLRRWRVVLEEDGADVSVAFGHDLIVGQILQAKARI